MQTQEWTNMHKILRRVETVRQNGLIAKMVYKQSSKIITRTIHGCIM